MAPYLIPAHHSTEGSRAGHSAEYSARNKTAERRRLGCLAQLAAASASPANAGPVLPSPLTESAEFLNDLGQGLEPVAIIPLLLSVAIDDDIYPGGCLSDLPEALDHNFKRP